MTDRLIPADYWLHHERYLRYLGHSKAAMAAANDPYLPVIEQKRQLERANRWYARATEEHDIANGLQP